MLTGDSGTLDETALFAPFERAPAILAAVSGGPDSMALMLLAARWGRGRGGGGSGRPRIEVATVDHGLRAGARAEAEMVARIAGSLGLPHHLLEWAGPKPATRLQERARAARYALLDACATRIGANVLWTAHHADDQAETILFRLQRGSGIAGLAGMATVSTRGGLTHGRPLLGVAKDNLVAFCSRERLEFVTDPSNADPRFARARLREIMPLLAQHGLGREEWLRLGARAARAEAALADYTRQTLTSLGARREERGFRVDFGAAGAPSREILVRVLQDEAARLHPHGVRPRLDRAESLALALENALKSGAAHRATLGGALVRLDREGALTLQPEKPRHSQRVRRLSSL